MGRLAERYRLACDPRGICRLASELGLSVVSLQRLGVGWAQEYPAWTFPMADGQGDTLGIRLRFADGRKLSVKGGREGCARVVEGWREVRRSRGRNRADANAQADGPRDPALRSSAYGQSVEASRRGQTGSTAQMTKRKGRYHGDLGRQGARGRRGVSDEGG